MDACIREQCFERFRKADDPSLTTPSSGLQVVMLSSDLSGNSDGFQWLKCADGRWIGEETSMSMDELECDDEMGCRLLLFSAFLVPFFLPQILPKRRSLLYAPFFFFYSKFPASKPAQSAKDCQ